MASASDPNIKSPWRWQALFDAVDTGAYYDGLADDLDALEAIAPDCSEIDRAAEILFDHLRDLNAERRKRLWRWQPPRRGNEAADRRFVVARQRMIDARNARFNAKTARQRVEADCAEEAAESDYEIVLRNYIDRMPCERIEMFARQCVDRFNHAVKRLQSATTRRERLQIERDLDEAADEFHQCRARYRVAWIEEKCGVAS